MQHISKIYPEKSYQTNRLPDEEAPMRHIDIDCRSGQHS